MESFGKGDSREGAAAVEGALVPLKAAVDGRHARKDVNVRNEFPPYVVWPQFHPVELKLSPVICRCCEGSSDPR